MPRAPALHGSLFSQIVSGRHRAPEITLEAPGHYEKADTEETAEEDAEE